MQAVLVEKLNTQEEDGLLPLHDTEKKRKKAIIEHMDSPSTSRRSCLVLGPSHVSVGLASIVMQMIQRPREDAEPSMKKSLDCCRLQESSMAWRSLDSSLWPGKWRQAAV